jgi:hypothetical protein
MLGEEELIFRVSWNRWAFPFSELVRVSRCLRTAEASLRKLLFCQVIRRLQVDAHFIHVLSDVNAKRKAARTVVIIKLMKRFPFHAMK